MKRLVDPAVTVSDLPVPDLILLSHAHMDHLDRPSLLELENPETTVVTAVGTILRRPEAALDASFGLRRMSRNPDDVQLSPICVGGGGSCSPANAL